MRSGTHFVLGLALCGALAAAGTVSEAWDLATLSANGAKVADYALAHPTRANHRDWTYGAFYAGLTAFALAHPERPYLDILRQEGTNNAWRLDGGRPFYAETHGIGQTWLELARVDDNLEVAAPTRAVFDYILENRSRAPVVQRLPNGTFSPNLLRWAWSDALFMSPPVWAKLAALTGEARYRDFLIGEYRASAARLHDREMGLFYRDYAARAKRSAHGAKVFWGRGNGWVLGGLPLVLRELPPDLRTRPFFLDLFRGMSVKLKDLQRADGAWSPNLLDGRDPDLPEMSATALFCFALAWGVNNGLLDEADYVPCVRRAWGALCRAVTEEGTLGWVQQAAVGPSADFDADSTALYAVGGYLLAATEIRKYVVRAAHRDALLVTVGPQPRFGAVTVAVPLADLALPVSVTNLVVFDERDGAVVPHQIVNGKADGKTDRLLFRTTLGACVPRRFWVFADAALASGATNAAVAVDGLPGGDFAYWRDGRAFRAPREPAARRVRYAGPVRTVVEFEFQPVDVGGGATVAERRTAMRDRGARYVVCTSSFTLSGAARLDGGPVLALGERGELTARPDLGWATATGCSARAAVSTRSPAMLQGVGAGEVALVRELPLDHPFVWLYGTACDFTEAPAVKVVKPIGLRPVNTERAEARGHGEWL